MCHQKINYINYLVNCNGQQLAKRFETGNFFTQYFTSTHAHTLASTKLGCSAVQS